MEDKSKEGKRNEKWTDRKRKKKSGCTKGKKRESKKERKVDVQIKRMNEKLKRKKKERKLFEWKVKRNKEKS